MFREMRRKDRAMTVEDARALLKDGGYGILSTVGEDGYAYGVPLNYAVEGDYIYMHCAIKGQKLDNLSFNDKVSFCVVGREKVVPEELTTEFESVIVFGRARLSADAREKAKGLKVIADKYAFDYQEKAADSIRKAAPVTQVIILEIEHITGKRSKKLV